MSNPATEKKQLPSWLVLTIIALVAALALALTNLITAGPIRAHAMKDQREAFGAVLMAEEYITPEGFDADTLGVTALVEAKSGGKTIGYCVTASANGYAGPVAVTLGVNADGTIAGAKIGDGSFVETAGFGARWLDEATWAQFTGISVQEGGSIEALSGATVTSNAVLTAANNALAAVGAVMNTGRTEPVLAFGAPAEKPAPQQPTLTGEVREGTARGFQSDVKVQLTLDESGAISNIAILSADETAGYGTRCGEDEAFRTQFIGKTAPLTLGTDIEALSGATVTSTAVVEAVNAAVTAPVSAPAGFTAYAPGYAGQDVGVTLTLNEDGIETITLDLSMQAPPVCDLCNTEEFLSQFIGKMGPFALGENVEAVSGATFTSEGIVIAVNTILGTMDLSGETPAETAAPEETVAPAAPTGTAYEATATGYQSEVKVTIYADDAGVITGIIVDSASETPGFGTRCAEDEAFLAQFIGKTAPVEVDTLSGATVTSKAVIEAVNKALPAAAPTAGDEAELVEAYGLEAPVQSVTLPGFGGSAVTVTLTLNEDGTIATMVVDASTQSPGLGRKCAESSFVDQFIGQAGPFTLGGNIDAVSYATVTSQTVVNAANSLTGQAAPISSDTLAEAAPAPLTTTLSSFGGGDVTVTLTLNEDGTIATMVVDASTQSPGLGRKCAEEEFIEQFLGQAGPFVLGEGIDAISYATVTSQTVVDAVNSLMGK